MAVTSHVTYFCDVISLRKSLFVITKPSEVRPLPDFFFMCNNLGPGWGPCLNLLENEIESRNEMQAVYVREGGLMIIYHIRDKGPFIREKISRG